MTHRLTTDYAKNYSNRALILKVIVENVVTCFLLGHGVVQTAAHLSFVPCVGEELYHRCCAGLVCVSSVAAERLKDGTDLVWHQDITATPTVC